jgi:nucleoside-diphosphate-sugar epimerase
VFVAGASGMVGARLVPLLVGAGHDVAALTRTPAKAERLAALGAEPVVADALDREALARVVRAFAPDLVMHQLTDLPDDAARTADMGAANARIRTEGTRNLLAAARAAGASRFLAQSIAWELPPAGAAPIAQHEGMVLNFGGVVLRYGQFYGPGYLLRGESPAPSSDPRR